MATQVELPAQQAHRAPARRRGTFCGWQFRVCSRADALCAGKAQQPKYSPYEELPPHLQDNK